MATTARHSRVYLGRIDLLDANGGSDIVQVAPGSITLVEGTDKIVSLRVTPKGLCRFYAMCCNTPLGNTVGPTIPFVAIIVQALEKSAEERDKIIGRPIGAIYGKYALGVVPNASRKISPGLILRGIRMVVGAAQRQGVASPLLGPGQQSAEVSDHGIVG
jgi:hypothetical protein